MIFRISIFLLQLGGNIACAGIGGVRPAEISIDGSIGFFTMTVNGTWEPIYGNAGSEASITSFDVDRQGLYLDYDVPAGFDFLSDATFGDAGPGSWQIHPTERPLASAQDGRSP